MSFRKPIKAAMAQYFDNDSIESDIRDWRDDVVAELNAQTERKAAIRTAMYRYYNFRHAALDAKRASQTTANAIIRTAEVRRNHSVQTAKFLLKRYQIKIPFEKIR